MINELPCGCKTKPFNNGDSFETFLLDKIAVWFDDPRCMEHEDGTDTVGFMLYKDNKVISHITRDGQLKIKKYNITDAVNTLNEFKEMGYDFSYGYMDMKENSPGEYTMYCTGS